MRGFFKEEKLAPSKGDSVEKKLKKNWYKIYCEDCFETFSKIKSNSVDLILCDPPYGMTGCDWDSIIPLDQMWEQINRVSKTNSAILLMAAQPFTTTLINSNPKSFRYCLYWNKVNRPSGFLDAKRRPLKIIEEVVVFYQKQPTYNPQLVSGKSYYASSIKDKFYGKRSSVSPKHYSSRYPTNLVSFPKDYQKRDGKGHPTRKPVNLMRNLIRTYSNEGDVVLDFAMGTGTTGVACALEKRNFIGCDNNPKPYTMAKSRIIKAFG